MDEYKRDPGCLYQAVLIRHGQSDWDVSNRFTGWADVDLTEEGMEEARQAGESLKRWGYSFDLAFTSYLKRAIKTLHIIMEEMNQLWLPEYKSWMLNERHYGALQGLRKHEVARQFGMEQIKKWRRYYDEPVPQVKSDDPRFPGNDEIYRNLPFFEALKGETLKDTEARVVKYWQTKIEPEIRNGRKALVVAHGNSLRALVKYLDNISPQEIASVEIPPGKPLFYEFTADLKPIRSGISPVMSERY
jgi:2,3-bisphosphoglycerate-dependent phosphoglycerate mutase